MTTVTTTLGSHWEQFGLFDSKTVEYRPTSPFFLYDRYRSVFSIRLIDVTPGLLGFIYVSICVDDRHVLLLSRQLDFCQAQSFTEITEPDLPKRLHTAKAADCVAKAHTCISILNTESEEFNYVLRRKKS
jgi:hypothetical protein